MTGRYGAAPSAPYKITALIAATRNSDNYSGAGIGWYDGINKIHFISLVTNNGEPPVISVNRWTNPTTFNGNDFTGKPNGFSQPIWFQIADDGTNVSFAFSQDGANFLPVFSIAKSSGWLGSSGYGNIILALNPQDARTIGTVMSWSQE